MARMRLDILKNGTGYDMTELVESVTWSGRKGAAARVLSVSMLDDPGYGHVRSGINVSNGNQCVFYWDKKELFRGIIVTQKQSESKKMAIEAYDSGIYLSNNKDSFTYSNKTATYIFNDICKRFDIKKGKVADTGYVIPELPKSKTTLFDVMVDALSLTYKATGKRFFPISMQGKLQLLRRSENVRQWIIEYGANLSSYNYTRSIDKVRTRIKLLSDKNKVLVEKGDINIEKKIGIFQDIDSPDKSLNKGQLDKLVKSMLKDKKQTEKSLDMNCMGIADVYTGLAVHVIMKQHNINRTFYIDSDTHIFKGECHTMNLKLNFAKDIDSAE